MDEPDDDLAPWLRDLDAYARDYTREDLARMAADGVAYYDTARAVWVVQGPTGPFEISNAELVDANPADYLLDAYDTRFDGYTRETLDDLVHLGRAAYDQERGVWVVHGEQGPYEVRDVDAPQHGSLDLENADGPSLEGLIDRAIIRYDAGLPPANRLESIVFRALRTADAGQADGATSGWRDDLLRQLDEAGVQASYEITYAGPLGNDLRPVRTFDEMTARHMARRMSGTGEQVDVTLVTSDGNRSVIGSYLDQQPLPDASGRGAEQWLEPPPWPASPIPAGADAARPPVPVAPGDPRATQLQFPQGISALPVTATSGGPLRPTRLLHPDGTALDFRPMGDSESVPAVAAGVAPATGDLAPGWLQVIQRENGNLVAAHPALISPRGVSPLGWLPHPQMRRFSEFDCAESAGRDSALLQAMFVERGDTIRTEAGELREVTASTALPQADGVKVTITTAGSDGQVSPQKYEGHQTVEVLIPAHHPAQDSPQAGHLFAMPGPEPRPRAGDGQDALTAEFDDLGTTLDWIRQDASQAGPRDAPAAPLPGPVPGPLPPSMAQAVQRRGEPPGPPGQSAIPQQAGWRVSARMTARMHQAQSAAAATTGSLAQNPAWRRLRSLTTSARRLAADASAGRLRFSDPAWALRSWRAVWARVCEMTCDVAAGLMTDWLHGPVGRRKGSRPWRAARALHHAAAEGAAHAHGWLPRHIRLPMGSYEIASRHGRTATPRAKASAAARQYRQAGPAGPLEFPDAVAKIADRATSGRPHRQPAARASGRQARTRPGPRLPR